MPELTKELELYYERYFDLFRSEGWKQLIEELKQNAAVVNSVEATKDSNDMHFRKGQLNVLAHLINLESIILNAYEGLEDDQSI